MVGWLWLAWFAFGLCVDDIYWYVFRIYIPNTSTGRKADESLFFKHTLLLKVKEDHNCVWDY